MNRHSERENERGFLIAVMALLIAMALIGFALYILPYLLWELHYDVPEFIPDWIYFFQRKGNLTEGGASWVLFLIFFIPGFIAGLFVYIAFNRIEQLKLSESSPETLKQDASNSSWKESSKLIGQLLILVLIIFVIMRFLDWFIASPVS